MPPISHAPCKAYAQKFTGVAGRFEFEINVAGGNPVIVVAIGPVQTVMLKTLRDLNLLRLSGPGLIALLVTATLAVLVGGILFFSLYSGYRGKAVVAIPVLSGGAILIAGLFGARGLLKRLGLPFYRYPVGTIKLFGYPSTRAAALDLAAFRPFIDDSELPADATLLIVHKYSLPLSDLPEAKEKALLEICQSPLKQIVWVLTNARHSTDPAELDRVIVDAKKYLSDRLPNASHVQFAIDSGDGARPQTEAVLIGWTAVADFLWGV